MIPNNVTRLLESRKIPFTVFELPAEKLGALEAARLMGAPPEQVYKTIVITREGKGKPLLVLLPGPGEVNLKALAAASCRGWGAPTVKKSCTLRIEAVS